MTKSCVLLLALAAALTGTTGTASTAGATTLTAVTSTFSYAKGALTASDYDCDYSTFYVCGIGTFDGKPALSLVHYPSTAPEFDGSGCVLYVVDETLLLAAGSAGLELRHALTLCPPTPNWFKNRGGGSNGNPFRVTSTWTVIDGSGTYDRTTGQGTWTVWWAGNAGFGHHAGTLNTR
jgi:hypothetical protein